MPPARLRRTPFPPAHRRLRLGLGVAIAITVAVAVGTAVPRAGLSLALSGIAQTEALASPAGMLLPATEADLVSAIPLAAGMDPAHPPGARQPASTRRAATIADLRRENLEVLLTSLAGAAVVVLLVACSNLGLLTIAFASRRRHGQAVRYAVGATRARIVRIAAAETLPLLMVGTLAGAGLTALIRVALHATWPADFRAWSAGGGSPLLGLAAALPLLVLVLAALLPSLRLTEREVREFVATGARATAGASASRSRDRLAALGIATAITLLFAAGILARGSGGVRPGVGLPYDPADTLVHLVDAARLADPGALSAALQALEAGLQASEAVEAVSIVTEGMPLGLGTQDRVHVLTGNLALPGTYVTARHFAVSAGTFAAFGIPLVSGREFEAGDGPGTGAVAMVNRTFLNRYFPSGALGRSVQLGGVSLTSTWFTIVGVVEDVRPAGLGAAPVPEPAIYLSTAQVPPPAFEILFRPAGETEAARDVVSRTVAASLPWAAQRDGGSLRDRLDAFRYPATWLARLFALLAAVAALLASQGLYGLVQEDVHRRVKEIGIRMAMGAPPGAIVRRLVLERARRGAGGVLLGFAGAICMGRLIEFFVAGTRLADPLLFAGVLVPVSGIGLTATYFAARAAARVDPAVTLSAE